ncbi:MAG: amidohydrolase family protein [Chloroflexota bacterium]
MIIDCHTHIFSPRIRENRSDYVRSDPVFAELYASPKARLITAPELIDSMDEAGIDVSVILNIGWRSLKPCIESNDYILESVARYPERLIGFCAVPTAPSDSALDEIQRCAGGGIRGVGEIRPDPRVDFRDRESAAPFVEVMKKHHLVLLTHASEPVGHEYPGKGVLTPGSLYPMIRCLAGLTVICAHWGGGLPFYTLMPEVKKALKDVYFDTAASPFLYRPEVYQIAARLVGAEKILFGSDHPVLPQKRLLTEIAALDMDGSAKELIWYGNAARLFGIKA